ncbi:hypothetical protein B0T21DRAFT_295653, partial [Apiosordaria backusii]
VTVGVFFGLSILSVIARVAIRLKTLRRLSLDDYLLFAAATALAVTTGLLFHSCDRIYLSAALQKDPALAFLINSELLMDLLNHATQQFHTFLILAWTATFFVKFSFLAFFRQLIWKTRVQRYYWSVVGITIVSYLFVVAEPFILCSEFGINARKFLPGRNHRPHDCQYSDHHPLPSQDPDPSKGGSRDVSLFVFGDGMHRDHSSQQNQRCTGHRHSVGVFLAVYGSNHCGAYGLVDGFSHLARIPNQ